jgi:hypothetical protein
MKMLLVFVGLLFALVAGDAVAAESRIALVIGNASYKHLDPLPNAGNDARDMSGALRSLGFDVLEGVDLDQAGLKAITRTFLAKLKGADAALFFYAGHGIQVQSINYLLPLDAELKSMTDVVFDAVPLQDIVAMMEREAKTVIVFLDACRDDPLREQNIGFQTRGLSIEAGLAPQSGAAGTYIAFAAEPGRPSYDGTGRNSYFTGALLKHMTAPGVDIRIMMSDVRSTVIEETAGRQIPWENSSLIGSFSVSPLTDARDSTRTDDEAERAAWETIMQSSRAENFVDFLEAFPNGVFASTARAQLRRFLLENSTSKVSPGIVILPAADEVVVRVPETAQAGSRRKAPIAASPPSKATQSGGATLAAIPPNVADIAGEPPPLERTANSAFLRRVQTALIRIGCLTGKADGIWGPRSRAAFATYTERRPTATSDALPDEDALQRLLGERRTVCKQVCLPGETNPNVICMARGCPSGQTLNANGECREIEKKSCLNGGCIAAAGFRGQWNLTRKAANPWVCGWSKLSTHLWIADGVVSGGPHWKGTVTEQGAFKLTHTFVYEGKQERNVISGTVRGSTGRGNFVHVGGNCRGTVALSKR